MADIEIPNEAKAIAEDLIELSKQPRAVTLTVRIEKTGEPKTDGFELSVIASPKMIVDVLKALRSNGVL